MATIAAAAGAGQLASKSRPRGAIVPPPVSFPESVERAGRALEGAVVRTPLFESFTLSALVGRPVLLKGEHLQHTGSFKARGALHRLRSMDAEARERGAVTVSAGNHAAAMAWAAHALGVDATVVMPRTAPRSKVDACRRYGARILLEDDVFEALARCLELRDRRGLTLVHPFDDPEIVEATGTVAMEIVEDRPDVGSVVVPVGGGGLIAGIASALAAGAPQVAVFGVEPVGADAMCRSLETGAPVRLERVDTVADGLGAPMAGERTYPLVRDHVREVVRLSDPEILAGLGHLLEVEKQVVEPAGAAGVGALLADRFTELLPPGPVVVVVSGGNLDLDTVGDLLARARAAG
jgi:threonine dehydratase